MISPVLLNIALHGMEEQAAGVRYWKTGRNAGWTATGSPVLVRYADDLIALCHTRDEALDDYVWKLTHKWATHGHPNKSKRWVVKRYFGMFNRSRRDK